jgi:hypothetical protein
MPQQIDIVANLLMKVDGAESGLKRLQNSLSGLKLPKGLDSDLKKSMSNLEGLFATYRKQIEKGFDTKGDVSAFTKTAKSVNAEYDRITRTLDKLNNTNVTFNIKRYCLIDPIRIISLFSGGNNIKVPRGHSDPMGTSTVNS